MRREHKRLLKLAAKRGLSKAVWVMLCFLEHVHGLTYAEKAARKWPMPSRGSA